MDYQEQMKLVKDTVVKLRYLESMNNIIYYDRWTACPKKGFDYEGQVGAYLTELRHEKTVHPQVKELVDALNQRDVYDNDLDRGAVRYLTAQYREARQIPAGLKAELNKANAEGQRAWEICCRENDFESFKPVLKKQFDIQRQIAEAIDPEKPVYQVLVNRFDKDYRLEEIDAVLEEMKQAVCEILHVVQDRHADIDDSILQCDASERTIRYLVRKAQQFLLFDEERSTLFEMHHPVCVCLGPKDSRPSTNFGELFHAIQAAIHESGHGFYNYNADDKVTEYGLWGGIGGAMHESQSRFYENYIGRSMEFWNIFYPVLQQEVPKYRTIPLVTFYRAINKVKPGLIRLQADELTNVLHIIIRYELEKEYFEGKLNVDTIEAAWNSKYREYLGVEPSNSREGILQDVHWASGSVGYFQGYALGDAYAAQFRHKLEEDCPDAFKKLGRGDISDINRWLKENVHRYGQMYTARETLRKATGEDLNTSYFIKYLRKKYVR